MGERRDGLRQPMAANFVKITAAWRHAPVRVAHLLAGAAALPLGTGAIAVTAHGTGRVGSQPPRLRRGGGEVLQLRHRLDGGPGSQLRLRDEHAVRIDAALVNVGQHVHLLVPRRVHQVQRHHGARHGREGHLKVDAHLRAADGVHLQVLHHLHRAVVDELGHQQRTRQRHRRQRHGGARLGAHREIAHHLGVQIPRRQLPLQRRQHPAPPRGRCAQTRSPAAGRPKQAHQRRDRATRRAERPVRTLSAGLFQQTFQRTRAPSVGPTADPLLVTVARCRCFRAAGRRNRRKWPWSALASSCGPSGA
jgi:hypothetical protein